MLCPFLEKRGATRWIIYWGSQVKLAEEGKPKEWKRASLYQSSFTGSGDLLNLEAHFFVSSDPAESMLLAASSSEELDVVEEARSVS